ncbi:hypothetical protein KC19_12G056400 [Ceratodon purpureus]|uniref:Uncharacterized protein n=1 Tax=Ceratodon purpureus TaxID=3225 RepID=A0A8T0G544_CERPU|nr:hypothetical protein KC19_12G056400 [Ceratodon purpureus]
MTTNEPRRSDSYKERRRDPPKACLLERRAPPSPPKLEQPRHRSSLPTAPLLRPSRSVVRCIDINRGRRLDDVVCWAGECGFTCYMLRSSGSFSCRAMAPCLCAPTIHKGSFRCRLHRVAARKVASDGDSCTAVSQASATVPCLCAPTSHPGSFRCHLHRATDVSWGGRPIRPSAHAKSLRNVELPPVKAADHSVGLKKAAFARTNRASTPSKLRSELSKAMPEIVAAVEDLRISPKKTYVLKTV